MRTVGTTLHRAIRTTRRSLIATTTAPVSGKPDLPALRSCSDRRRLKGALRYLTAAAIAAAVGAPLLASPPTVRADPVDTTAVVLKVVDGDTADIRDDVRGRLRIRLLGIDSPETKNPGYTVGCWGPEATEFATSTLLGQRVELIYDQSQGLYDRYGRTLAYLDKADGWDYSIEAARAGVAHVYIYHGQPAARYPQIAAAENEARDAQRGLWGPPCFGNTESIPQ
jgi:micrococcal nuclease